MKGYKHTCPDCGREGIVSTTDSPPEKDALCSECWRKEVVEKALYHIKETWPHPARLDFICEMLVKEHGLEWESPLRMMRLDADLLKRMLRRTGRKFRFETMIFLDENPDGSDGQEVGD